MELSEGSAAPVSQLTESVNSGFARLVNRYLSAWSDASQSINPPLIPTDTYFASDRLSRATDCFLCSKKVDNNDQLCSHMARGHPNTPLRPPVLAPEQMRFPNPLKALETMPNETETSSKAAKGIPPSDSWLPVSSEVLHEFSPLAAQSPSTSLDGKAAVTNPSLYCSLCSVQCISVEQLAKHWDGQKHKKKLINHLAFMEAKKRFEEEGLQQVTPASWRCTFCHSDMNGKTATMQHLNSVKHKKSRRTSNSEIRPLRKRIVVSSLLNNPPPTCADLNSRNVSPSTSVIRAQDNAVSRSRVKTGKEQSGTSQNDNSHGKQRGALSILRAAQQTSKHSWNRSHLGRATQAITKTDQDGSDEHMSAADSSESLRFVMSGSSGAEFSPDVQAVMSDMSIDCGATQPIEKDMAVGPAVCSSPHLHPTVRNPQAKQQVLTRKQGPRQVRKDESQKAREKTPTTSISTIKACVSCVLCEEYFESVKSLSAHLIGDEHNRRQMMRERQERHARQQELKRTELFGRELALEGVLEKLSISNVGASKQAQSSTTKRLYCEVCNISCTSPDNLISHLQGKPHAKRMRATASQ